MPLFASLRRLPPLLWASCFLFFYMVITFRVVLPAHATLHAQDYNIGLMAFYRGELPAGLFQGFWRDMPLLGRVGHHPPTWHFLLLSLLPVHLFFNWIYGLNLLLASLFLIAWLRRKGVGTLPALLGALVALWMGNNLTLLHPGHLEKFGVVLFACATLWGIEQSVSKRSLPSAVFTGGCVAMMFMHQGDVALFFGLPLGLYLLLELRTNRVTPKKMLTRVILPMAIPLALMSVEAYHHAMRIHVQDTQVMTEADPDARWAFATQWSQPPRELPGFVLPGFYGWYSGHPEAPYHGTTGRSAAWDTEGTGFPNFMQESPYLGFLAFALAVLGICLRPRDPTVRFWAGAALLTLLLSFGKYTPVYALFYRLPLVPLLRNPNKFLQAFQLATGILAAYGLQALLTSLPARPRTGLHFARVLGICGGLFLLGGLLTTPDDPLLLHAFSTTPWADVATQLVEQQQRAWGGAAIMTLLAAAAIWAAVWAANKYPASPRTPPLLGCALLFLVSVDAQRLSRHYIQPFQTRFLTQNALADFLENRLESSKSHRRVTTLDQSGIYNLLITHLFHYRRIPVTNITAAPRLDRGYTRYLETHSHDPIREWREFGVQFVLMDRPTWEGLAAAGWSDLFEEVFAYDVDTDLLGGLRLVPATRARPGDHVVLELLLPAERFTLLDHWTEADGDLHTDFGTHRPAPGSGEILEIQRHPAGFEVNLRVDIPHALLRLSDRHDPRMRVTFADGTTLPLLPVDDLFAGVVLEAGTHQLTFSFQEDSPTRILQWLGLIFWIGIPAGNVLLQKIPVPNRLVLNRLPLRFG